MCSLNFKTQVSVTLKSYFMLCTSSPSYFLYLVTQKTKNTAEEAPWQPSLNMWSIPLEITHRIHKKRHQQQHQWLQLYFIHPRSTCNTATVSTLFIFSTSKGIWSSDVNVGLLSLLMSHFYTVSNKGQKPYSSAINKSYSSIFLRTLRG